MTNEQSAQIAASTVATIMQKEISNLKSLNIELLEALENLLICFDDDGLGDASIERINATHAAIAKAKGDAA